MPSGVSMESPTSKWAATPEEVARYSEIFSQDADKTGSGFAGPGEAKDVMEKSGLPVSELSQIWQTSDVDGDGRLSRVEFVCAMALVARRLQGAPLPNPMPAELLMSVIRVSSSSPAGVSSSAELWSPS